MQNILKQLKQNFKVYQFESYKNCIGERVYSMVINNNCFTIKREHDCSKLFELGYHTNNNFEVERNLTKSEVIKTIMEI